MKTDRVKIVLIVLIVLFVLFGRTWSPVTSPKRLRQEQWKLGLEGGGGEGKRGSAGCACMFWLLLQHTLPGLMTA